MASGRNERALRADLAIALVAVFVSAATAAASIYQSSVLSSQLTATVWPYLTVSRTVDNFPGHSSTLEVAVRNAGTGPAIVRGAYVVADGRQMAHFSQLISRLGLHGDNLLMSASLGRGYVLEANEKRMLLKFRLPPQNALQDVGRVSVDVCYCSVLSTCWHLQGGADQPQSVHDCKPNEGYAIDR